MAIPPEDNFRRDSDPVTRRNATILGALIAASLAVLAAGFWLARQPQPATTGAAVTARATLAPLGPPSLKPTPVPAEPVEGAGFSAADDPSAHQLVVFGGIDSYDQTWLWDGHRWSLARPRVSPPGRFRAAAAYDPLTRVVMLYGGRLGPGQLVGDTWAWDGATWQELDTGAGNPPPGAGVETGSPPPGEGAVMAWDDVLGEMVLVAGAGNTSGETWTWRNTRWVRTPGGDVPVGASFVAFAVDPISRALLAVSCCSPAEGATTTWAWDGTAWRSIRTRAQPAFTATLALDPAGGRLLLLADPVLAAGREMWSWSGQDWSPLTGARLPAFPQAEITDLGSGQVVILGSFAEPVQGSPQPIHVWSWTEATWRQLG